MGQNKLVYAVSVSLIGQTMKHLQVLLLILVPNVEPTTQTYYLLELKLSEMTQDQNLTETRVEIPGKENDMSYPICQDITANKTREPEIHSTVNDIRDSLESLEDELNMLCTRLACISAPPMPQAVEASPPRGGMESPVGNELASILSRVRTARDTIKDARSRLCV